MPSVLDFLFRPPQEDESRLGYGLRKLPADILAAAGRGANATFGPGGRLDLLHGGAFNAQNPGSIANQGAQIVGRLFNTDKGAEEVLKAANYATGPAMPPKPPAVIAPPKPATAAAAPPGAPAALAATMFGSGWAQTGKPGDPRDGGARRHAGWDFAPTGGDPNIRAHRPFEVVDTSTSKLGGNIATVRFDDGSTYKFMHLARLPAKGATGGKGDIFATAGKTGNATGVTTHVQPVGDSAAPDQAFGPLTGEALKLAQATGLGGGTPGFDSSGYDQADAMLGRVQQNSMRPFGATYERQELLPPPTPDAMVGADYTASDAAFQQAKPKSPFGGTPEEEESGKLRMRRGDYFAGMAKALASIDWSSGPGLGELFAKMGAGAVMGAQVGDERVRELSQEHEAAMQRFNLALANREEGKAKEAASVLNQNVQQMNVHKQQLWSFNNRQIEADQPQIVNGVLVTKHKNQDGTITETHTPLDPTREASALTARANLALSRANAENEAEWQSFRFNQQLFGTLLPYHMADAQARGDLQTRDGIYAFGLSDAANGLAASGQWENVYNRFIPGGSKRVQQIRQEAATAAGVGTAANPTEAQREQIEKYVASQIVVDFVGAGKSWVLTGGNTRNADTGEIKHNDPADIVSIVMSNDRERDRKVSRTTNSRGQTSVTERY